MSKTAPPKKKVGAQSSTESSSGSSSDSSTSSTSSSGSDSSSSSDSDSSSSQQSSKGNSGSEQKKPIPVAKTQRKSSDSTSKHGAATKSVTDSKQKPHAVQKSTQKVSKTAETYSSDELVSSKKSSAPKRKNVVKPKTTATAASKVQSKHVNINGKTLIKASTKNKSIASKEMPTKTSKQVSKQMAVKVDTSKKKSIFSPENSSESEAESSSKAEKANKMPTLKPRPKATVKAKTVDKPRPPEKVKTITKAKTVVSSASSISSSSESSSSSDSDSSEESADTSKSKGQKKKPSKKPAQKETNTDSEPEIISKQVTRKLTRSASTRKSKHVLGKSVYSDSDSDTESIKRSLSRSPVKRGAISTKGKAKNNTKRAEIKPRCEEISLEERKCPIEGCNSLGHLSGKYESHFTVEACPFYHNAAPSQCKDQVGERKKREDFRKKALDIFRKSPRTLPTNEQKQYLQKVKDLRAKFKIEDVDEKPTVDKNHEPSLSNFVPDYDLKLFRDAQAISSEKIEEDLKTQPNTKGTKYIEMGKFEMEVWYQSPYPEDFARLPKLYICEFCLRYMKSRTIIQRHIVKCVWRHPPGEEVYRKDKISVWEVDGKRYKQYCQNLCLLAKFFLDHKTLYYDVEPFLFYVMTMYDSEGCHTVGYFSKEKNSFLNYNVSCILTLPPYQRQGYGRLLIDFSYLLTRVEGKIGSPEKPLSDLGLISYRSYWKDVLLGYICYRAGTTLSVKDISQEMAIHSYDIVSTLQALGMMKYWKGKHIILKKQDVLDEYLERVKRRGSLLKQIDPTCLRWKPFVPAQPNPT